MRSSRPDRRPRRPLSGGGDSRGGSRRAARRLRRGRGRRPRRGAPDAAAATTVPSSAPPSAAPSDAAPTATASGRSTSTSPSAPARRWASALTGPPPRPGRGCCTTRRCADARYVNVGVSGSTVSEALSEQLPRALAADPDVVTVWLAVNDITHLVPVEAYEQQLRTLVHALRRDGRTEVLVANVPQVQDLPAYRACLPGAARPGDCVLPVVPSEAQVAAVVDSFNAASRPGRDGRGSRPRRRVAQPGPDPADQRRRLPPQHPRPPAGGAVLRRRPGELMFVVVLRGIFAHKLRLLLSATRGGAGHLVPRRDDGAHRHHPAQHRPARGQPGHRLGRLRAQPLRGRRRRLRPRTGAGIRAGDGALAPGSGAGDRLVGRLRPAGRRLR